MVGLTDKRLVWSPRDDSTFVVGGGSNVTLYEWDSSNNRISLASALNDLQALKCFAWSPSTRHDDLVALGNTSGRVDLMHLRAGVSSVDRVLTPSLPVSFFNPKNSRPCNSLSFSPFIPQHLAVGLDKVRGDSSLLVWDIEASSATEAPLDTDRIESHIGGASPSIKRVAGSRQDGKIICQFGTGDAVNALSYVPHNPNLLVAGMSNRWLRLFDTRNPNVTPTAVPNRAHFISVDLFDTSWICSLGDNTVSIWDARKFTRPLLSFTNRDATGDGAELKVDSVVHEADFSRSRRGLVATLDRDATHIRYWHIQQAEPVEDTQTQPRQSLLSQGAPITSSKLSRLQWGWNTSSTSNPPTQELAEPTKTSVLVDTKRSKDFTKPLASFALVPIPDSRSYLSMVLVLTKECDLEMHVSQFSPNPRWSCRGSLAIGRGTYLKSIAPQFEGKEIEPWKIAPPIANSQSELVRHPSSSNLQFHEPGFGRGDRDGFPALMASISSSLSASRIHRNNANEKPDSAPRLSRFDNFERGRSTEAHSGKRGRKSRSASRVRVYAVAEDTPTALLKDVSVDIRRRVLRGYGLDDLRRNAEIVSEGSLQNDVLHELWTWVNHVKDNLYPTESLVLGFDFSYRGVIDVWEGFTPVPEEVFALLNNFAPSESDLVDFESSTDRSLSPILSRNPSRRTQSPGDARVGNYDEAVQILNRRFGYDRDWKSPISTSKAGQRTLALNICGWNFGEDELSRAIVSWEKSGNYSRAACWLTFNDQYAKAAELLMKSKDEKHNMISGLLAALVHHSGTSSSFELREHCDKLITRLQDPYLRAMLTHAALEDWSEVLEDDALPLRERLAIALRYLEDSALTSFLRSLHYKCKARGDLQGIILTGLQSPAGLDVMQSYLDVSGDVQTATLLSSLTLPASEKKDTRPLRWLSAYRDLLDGWKLFHHRVQFDIERGAIQRTQGIPGGPLADVDASGDTAHTHLDDYDAGTVVLRCSRCSKSLGAQTGSDGAPLRRKRATECANCGQAFPSCSICLASLAVPTDSFRNYDMQFTQPRDSLDEAIVFCQTCRHGGHAGHVLEWFYGENGDSQGQDACPVPGCDCRCYEETMV